MCCIITETAWLKAAELWYDYGSSRQLVVKSLTSFVVRLKVDARHPFLERGEIDQSISLKWSYSVHLYHKKSNDKPAELQLEKKIKSATSLNFKHRIVTKEETEQS